MIGMIPLYWRLKKHRYNLIGSNCISCGGKHFPPRTVCPGCGSEDMLPFRFSGFGRVVSYTDIYIAPSGFEGNTPYRIALIKLDEGPTLSAEVVDSDNVVIGSSVKAVFRKQNDVAGLITYSLKFEVI